MIRDGDNPEGRRKGINKFIARSGDGQRGHIIAIKTDEKEAIMVAMNESFAGDVKWGKFYLVREKIENQYPIVIREVKNVPASKNWKIIGTSMTK